jgi:hypothetical protein
LSLKWRHTIDRSIADAPEQTFDARSLNRNAAADRTPSFRSGRRIHAA